MNRLFDKAKRNRYPLYWPGTRPVDRVRAAERRALSAGKPGKWPAAPAAPLPVGPFR